MEQPPPPQPPSATTQSTEHQQPLPPPSSLPIPSSSLPSTPTLTPNPTPTPTPPSNPNPRHPTPQPQQPSASLQNSQTRPPFSRTWPQQTPHFSHFSSMTPPQASSSSSSSSSASSTSPMTPPVPSFSSSASSMMAPSSQRGGMAIGVPAHQPSPPPPSTSFSSMNPPPSFGQQFGGLGRSSVNVPDSSPNSSTSQVRMQGMGMTGSLGSPVRPVGVPLNQQQPQRPIQSSLRPQSISTQNFQGHSLLRVQPGGSPASPAPSTSQSTQPSNQPWLSASQGKPPLPYRPLMNPQQRSHVPLQQHHQSMPTPPPTQQQQQTSSATQSQASISHQPQEHYGQQFAPPRMPSLANQQLRSQGLAQKSMAAPTIPAQTSSGVQPSPANRAAASGEPGESSTRILSKRSIQELVTQIDPMERLDPEVEDILMDIADEFIESITTFGCSLAKHRKSSTLEAKDILLHLERNWNMTLPGFGGDEIKSYKKPAGSDIHRERLAVIKKSIVASEMSNAKSSTGQAGGNSKGHMPKPPANVIGSPNP